MLGGLVTGLGAGFDVGLEVGFGIDLGAGIFGIGRGDLSALFGSGLNGRNIPETDLLIVSGDNSASIKELLCRT